MGACSIATKCLIHDVTSINSNEFTEPQAHNVQKFTYKNRENTMFTVIG